MHDDANCPYIGEYQQQVEDNARLCARNAALREACAAAVTYISLVCGTDRTATLDKLRAVLASAPPPAGGGG